ncbi:MAG: hypothetical protein HYZ47_03875, partial [Simkania negevensis]|nr:hypothetical protein [Simkania negevensis]
MSTQHKIGLKKNIFKRFLDNSLKYLADPKYQESVRIKGQGKVPSSFGKSMCCFFDDYGGMFEEMQDEKWIEYGIDQKLLMNFYRELNDFLQGHPSQVSRSLKQVSQILQGPNGEHIQQLAKENLILQPFSKHLEHKFSIHLHRPREPFWGSRAMSSWFLVTL